MQSADTGGNPIDGRPIQEYGTRELREGIAFSTAEGFLFNMTIRDNITLGGEYTADEIVEAAKIAGIHEFTMSLPHGADTVVGERGTKLSDGEKQRIALARAVIRKPKILILDEATSGVDSKTEAQIYERLRNLGATLIVVAHRLSTIHMGSIWRTRSTSWRGDPLSVRARMGNSLRAARHTAPCSRSSWYTRGG